MKNKILTFLIVLSLLISCTNSSKNTEEFQVLNGPYLGQKLPDSIPELFAPGIVGTGMFTRDIAISPGGDEIYYCIALGNYTYATIVYTKLVEGSWTKTATVPFASSGKIIDFEPAFSPKGNRLYFLSARSDGEEEAGDQDIWYVDRTEDGWSQAVNPGSPLNTDGGEFFPSCTNDGYLYFTHNDKGSGLNEIFRSRTYIDSFGIPEKLPVEVNCGTNRFNAFVSPDHSFVIVPAIGMEDAFDQVDYYITFRNKEDQWSKPLNLGEAINKDNTRGWSPYLSPDGKYFFFMSNISEEIIAEELSYDALLKLHNSSGNGNADIYWMKADFIIVLKNKAEFE